MLLRPSPATLAREDFFRVALAGPVLVSDAAPARGQLAVTLTDSEVGRAMPAEPRVLDVDPAHADLEIAAELFLSGCSVNWEQFFPNGTGAIVSAPAYPFTDKPFWLNF